MNQESQMPLVAVEVRGGCFKCNGKGYLKQTLSGHMWHQFKTVLCSCAQIKPKEETKDAKV